MKVLVLLLAVCVVLAAAAHRSDELKFRAWKTKHHKHYATLAAEKHALENFRLTLERLRVSNDESLGVNSLSDLSPAEFKAKYLHGYQPAALNNARVLYSEEDGNDDAPTSFDWRSYDAKSVTPVKDQASCGSCWAFSATEGLESQWYLTNAEQQILSPQQTVSCDKVDQGCNGGDLPSAYQYMEKAGGVETEKAYPYTSQGGATGKCKFNASRVVAKVDGFSYAIPPCNDSCKQQSKLESALKVAVAAASDDEIHGPPAICVNAEPWQDYVGPAPLKVKCSGAYTSLDHCVQLVGYNGDAATPYWIVRNSWGTSWGVNGYIHLKMNMNQCGLADEVVFPHAVKKQ